MAHTLASRPSSAFPSPRCCSSIDDDDEEDISERDEEEARARAADEEDEGEAAMRWRTSKTARATRATRQQGDRAISLSRWREPHQRKSKINQQYHTRQQYSRERETWMGLSHESESETSSRHEQQATTSSNSSKKVFDRGRCSLPHSFALSHERTRTSQALARDPHKTTTTTTSPRVRPAAWQSKIWRSPMSDTTGRGRTAITVAACCVSRATT